MIVPVKSKLHFSSADVFITTADSSAAVDQNHGFLFKISHEWPQENFPDWTICISPTLQGHMLRTDVFISAEIGTSGTALGCFLSGGVWMREG